MKSEKISEKNDKYNEPNISISEEAAVAFDQQAI